MVLYWPGNSINRLGGRWMPMPDVCVMALKWAER